MRYQLAALAAVFLLLLGLPQNVAAQARAVTGTITDARTGEPIVGAQVSIRDRGLGVISNEAGRFLMVNLPEGRLELRVLFVGYAPQSRILEVSAGETAVEDFQLTIQAIQLEALVATGYAQQTRREVSSSISTVASADLEAPAVASVDAILQGKAAGVQVTQNAGNPGNGITVRVRGSSSISASNQPLYVVDGMPIFRGDFSQIGLGGQDLSAITGLNPDEIESVAILKDAAAAAIYGSRGSNGVVLITTKRGNVTLAEGGSGAPRFQFNMSRGQQKIAKKVDVMNTAEWMDYFSDAMRNDGYSEQDIQDEFEWLGVDPSVDTDWQDEVLRTAPITNSSLSISGGSSRFRYLVSGSYFDQTGIVIGSSYNRASGRVNLDLEATDRINVAVSMSLSQEVNERIEADNSITSAVTNAIANEPWVPVYNDDGTYSSSASYANPVGIGLENEVEARTLRGFGNIEATAVLFPWLRATSRVGFDYLDLREYEYQSSEVALQYAYGQGGIAQIGNSQGRRHLTEAYLTANRFFGAHELGLTTGASTETTDREVSFARGEGFTSPDLHWPTNAARAADVDGTMWEHNLISGFARANYTYDNRYIVNGSIRSDGSSRFGQDKKWGTFLSLSAAWQLTNESFMDDVDFLTDLKLRASYGETGNEAIGNFQFLGLYGTANYGDLPGTAPSNLSNPGLKWETTTEWNVGIDASLFSDRIGLVFDLYKKKTDDLLLNRPVTSTSGFTSVLANVGAMENRGWEAIVRTVNVQGDGTGGLEWTTDLSVTHNVNEVTKLYSPDPNEPGEPFMGGWYNRVEEGHPIGEFYTVHYEGVDPATGDALFTDLDADGNRIGTTTDPSSEDRMYVGSPHPDYFGGLRNTLRVAGFDLTAFLQYSFGNSLFNAMREYSDDGGYFYDNKFADVGDDYWTPENTDASQPRPSYFGSSGAREESDRWLEDASYTRLQEVTLGYTLPSSLAGRLKMQQARIYLAGRNLYTWTEYSGYSPDMNTGGSDAGAASLAIDFYGYPFARSFTIGFQGIW
ncbi:MAG: TonB-dependent receptor [Gemmatimonadales bacterium]|nr:MAG: TonB-dependent receptor [Gemmatimonadales bacterium]